MGVNSLEQSQCNPNVHGDHMAVGKRVGEQGNNAVDKRAHESTSCKEKDFGRMSILCGQTERRRVLVVNLVDMLIENTSVKRAVAEEMPTVFKK